MWGYLFLYGAPDKPKEVFSNLGFLAAKEVGQSRTIEGVSPTPKDTTRLSLGGGPLEQITTRAVAGFTFLEDAPEVIRYAERGTGHIFEIDLATGLERQVSLTTVPQIVSAVFSKNGDYVALTAHTGYRKQTSVGTIVEGDNAIRLIELKEGASDIHFVGEKKVTYTVMSSGTTVGYSRNIETLEETVLFEVPFGDSVTTVAGGATYISPRPSADFEGALYEVQTNRVAPRTASYFGFSGFMHKDTPVYVYVENGTYKGGAMLGSEHTEQGIVLLSEKCAPDNTVENELLCAAPLTTSSDYLEDWYKGTLRSEDFLWRTDLQSGSAELIEDLGTLANRALDVDGITSNRTGSKLLLRNKIDDTLWLYKVTK
jgi:hypothetical protein